MLLGLIWAQDLDGVIGVDGELPWNLPPDLRRFQAITRNCSVLMGRKTWESLPKSSQPLPGRHNVVVSRNRNFRPEGAMKFTDLSDALHELQGVPRPIWVIGGAELYQQCLPMAQRISLTLLNLRVKGDSRAPRIELSAWNLVGRERHEHQGLQYQYADFIRK